MRNKIVLLLIILIGLTSCVSKKQQIIEDNKKVELSEQRSFKFLHDKTEKDEIFIAATKNNVPLVRRLLSNGHNINTALQGAVNGMHDELINYLIKSGADVSIAIIKAAEIRYYLEAKKDNNNNDQISFYTKTIDRLLSSYPWPLVNFDHIVFAATMLKDNRFLSKIVSMDHAPLSQIVLSDMGENKDMIKPLLINSINNFCIALDIVIEQKILIEKELKELSYYKEGCDGRFVKTRGAVHSIKRKAKENL